MASSSSSAAPAVLFPQEDIAPLPLIRCPRCNIGVTQWYISNTTKNPGRHFYKCQFHGPNGCSFWKWEEAYVAYFRARWGHIFAGAPAPPIEVAQQAILLQTQEDTRKILVVAAATLAAVLLMIFTKLLV